MAASVEYGMVDGLSFREDPETGAYSYSVMAHVKDLDPVGGGTPFGTPGEELALIAAALALLPGRGAFGPIAGTVLLHREPEPLPPCDCMVKLNFGRPRLGAEGAAVRIRVGTTTQQTETEFDAANRALAFASRVAISVQYDVNSAGVPAGSAPKQGGRVPWYAPKSTVTYIKTLNYDPSALSRTYSSRRNNATWKGLAAGTVLCLEIFGDSNDGGNNYETTFSMAYDPDEKWLAYDRYVDPLTGKPPSLTNAQIAAGNGIGVVNVQGDADFSLLPI